MRRAWLLALLAGCAPLAGNGRARTLGRGRTEVTVVPEATVMSARLASGPVPLPSLQLAAGVAHGAHPSVDVGARVWGFSVGKLVLETVGGGGEVRWQLKRREETGGGPDVALAARVAYHRVALGGTPEHAAAITVPFLIGWPVGRGELVIAPQLGYQVWWSESQHPLKVPLGGLSAAYAWRFGARWSLVPELVLMYSPLSFNGESASRRSRGLTILSLGLGVGYAW